MKYTRFEDVPVWQDAIQLADEVYAMTDVKAWKGSWSLRDQIERAVLSISNNIAEGFERGTTNELIAFLYISRGSAGEVRSMLCFIERLRWAKDLKSQIPDLKLKTESCSRQLRGWADHLQNSDIKGQRHLTDKARRGYAAAKETEAFERDLLDRLPPDHPLRKKDPK